MPDRHTTPPAPKGTEDRGTNTMQNRTGDGNLARRLTAAEKRRDALELRIAGRTYREIADEVGYRSTASAHEAVKKELAAIPRDAAIELRNLELQRLDEAQVAIFKAVRAGNFKAVDRLAKIIDLRAKLTGTYTMPVENDANKDVKVAFAGLMARAATHAAKGEEVADDDDLDTPEPA